VVAVGKGGTILTSPDAVSWTSRSANTAHWIYRVRNLGGNLIAVGQNGMILTSTDGTQWTARNSGTSRWLNDIQLVEDTYFVIGTQGTMLTSTDLVSWTNLGTITGKSLSAAATANGQLVVAGIEGVILRSQISPFTTPVDILKYPTKVQENIFLFTGQSDQRFRLDRSSRLPEWENGSELEITDDSGTLIYVDSSTNNSSLQLFRTAPVR
jgi:hypothetical protein